MLIPILCVILAVILLIMIVKVEKANKDLIAENEALGTTLDAEIKDYDDLKEENLHLYTQLKEYQDRVEKIENDAEELQEKVGVPVKKTRTRKAKTEEPVKKVRTKKTKKVE
jgi:predicted nuclease with TOPRIM domain